MGSDNDENNHHTFINKLNSDNNNIDFVNKICYRLPLQFVTNHNFIKLWLRHNENFYIKVGNTEYTVDILNDSQKQIKCIVCLRNDIQHGLCQLWYYCNNDNEIDGLSEICWYVSDKVHGQYTC